MCNNHPKSSFILCGQCDMLVAIPALDKGEKACCPRCGNVLTVHWDMPRQRPAAYAAAALFMLVLANLFPFVTMSVAGVTSEIS